MEIHHGIFTLDLKTSLYRSLREVPFCGPVQFRTIVAEIEAAVNSRPLTPVTAAPGVAVLTLNHILKVKYPATNFENEAPIGGTKAAQTLSRISKHVNEQINQFWTTWKTYYLQFLRERSATMKFQHKASVQKPQIGDVVIVKDKLRKRAYWRLAKIVELIVSEDAQVRAAKIQLGNGNRVSRPLIDLYYLELNESEDQCGETLPHSETAEDNPGSPSPSTSQESYILDSVEIIEE